MGLEMTFRNLDPSDAMRARAEKKLGRILNKFRDQDSDAHMVFSVEKHRHRVELTIKVQGEQLTIHDETDDMYTSIDNVMNKAARAARRAQDRKLAMLRAGGEMGEEEAASLDDDDFDDYIQRLNPETKSRDEIQILAPDSDAREYLWSCLRVKEDETKVCWTGSGV